MVAYPAQQLEGLSRHNPAGRKILFVPSLQVGHNLTSALARRGISTANLMVTTPHRHARQWAEPHLRARGHSPLVEGAGLFIVDGLLRRLIREDEEGVFARFTAGPGLARTFLDSIEALRTAGVTVDHDGVGTPAVAKPLRQVYQAYGRYLATNGYYDVATLYRIALGLISGRADSRTFPAVVAIMDQVHLPGLAYRYVQQFADRAEVSFYRIGQETPPDQLARTRAAQRFRSVSCPPLPESSLFSGPQKEKADSSTDREGRIHRVETMGVENEVRYVLKTILAQEIPLDSVEITYTSRSPYLSTIYDLVRRYDCPATFGDGIPAVKTNAGRLLLAFFRWIRSGYQVHHLIAMCRTERFDWPRTADGISVPGADAVRWLRQARIGRGRAQYVRSLANLKHEVGGPHAESGTDPTPDEQIDALIAGVQSFWELIPEEGRVAVQHLANAGTAFLNRFVVPGSELEEVAITSLTDRLSEVGDFFSRPEPTQRILSWLIDLTDRHRIQASVARPGKLYVTPLERAGFSGRERIYVLGLDSNSFPGSLQENPFLMLEAEADDRPAELQRSPVGDRIYELDNLFDRSTAQITLCCRRIDLAEGREVYPSSFYQRAIGTVAQRQPIREDLISGEGPFLDDTGTLLASREAPEYASLVTRTYPLLTDGWKAEQARHSDAITPFDGWLKQSRLFTMADGEGDVFSASQLETLARCPYRYFLRHILEVDVLDEVDPDPSRWLDPAELGSLLHEVYAQYIERLMQTGERPRAEHASLLKEIAQQEIEAYRERIPVPNRAAYRADRRRIHRAIRIFLAAEADRTVDPAGTEVSFGYGEDGALSSPSPVRVDLIEDVSLRLRGRIDRIDRAGDALQVWDYKTGSNRGYQEDDLLQGGLRLQWALYAYVLDEVVQQRRGDGKVRESGYFFASDRGHGRRISQVPPERELVGRVLRPLLAMASQGGYLHVQKEEQCRYCDFNRICADERRMASEFSEMQVATEDPGEHPPFMEALAEWLDES